MTDCTVLDRPPPPSSLLAQRAVAGEYVDAYCLQVPEPVALSRWVAAFYSTRLFAAERCVLTLLGHPSRRAQAHALARGERETFAAWRVTALGGDELLLTDATGRTRSWLSVQALHPGTALWFGSALRTRQRHADGSPRLTGAMKALLGLHERYSRALLRAGARDLLRGAA